MHEEADRGAATATTGTGTTSAAGTTGTAATTAVVRRNCTRFVASVSTVAAVAAVASGGSGSTGTAAGCDELDLIEDHVGIHCVDREGPATGLAALEGTRAAQTTGATATTAGRDHEAVGSAATTAPSGAAVLAVEAEASGREQEQITRGTSEVPDRQTTGGTGRRGLTTRAGLAPTSMALEIVGALEFSGTTCSAGGSMAGLASDSGEYRCPVTAVTAGVGAAHTARATACWLEPDSIPAVVSVAGVGGLSGHRSISIGSRVALATRE